MWPGGAHLQTKARYHISTSCLSSEATNQKVYCEKGLRGLFLVSVEGRVEVQVSCLWPRIILPRVALIRLYLNLNVEIKGSCPVSGEFKRLDLRNTK